MSSFLANLHQVFGYALFLAMVVVAGLGWLQGPRGRAFDDRPFRAVAGLVSLQLVLGIVVYVARTTWSPFVVGLSLVHPLLMVVGTGLAHAAVSRGRRTDDAAQAWRGAGTLLAISVVFVAAGIGVASSA